MIVDYGDGATDDVTLATRSFTRDHRFADNGLFNTRIMIRDDDGNSVEKTLAVTVRNVAPTIQSTGGPYVIDEGSSLTLAATATDPALAFDPLTFAWDLNGDGIFSDATGANPTLTWSTLRTFGIVNGPATHTLRLQVSDGDGGVVTSDAIELTVRNVAPIPVIVGLPPVNAQGIPAIAEGLAIQFSDPPIDPGTSDQFRYEWTVTKSGKTVMTSDQESFTFTPTDNGLYQVRLVVRDEQANGTLDGGVGVLTKSFQVTNVLPSDIALDANQSFSATEDTPISWTGTFTDPSGDDSFRGTADMGDGTLVPVAITTDANNPLLRHFQLTHTFARVSGATQQFPIIVRITDDDGGNQSTELQFAATVTAIADTPSLSVVAANNATVATTNEDTLSTDKIVITKSLLDGAEVTHFQITDLRGGTFFLADGATEVHDGDFLTIEQGAAGMRFRPAANSKATGTFAAQSSQAADHSGLGGGREIGSITVNAVNDPPSFMKGTNVQQANSGYPVRLAGWATNLSPTTAGLAPLPVDESSQSLRFVVTGNSHPALFVSPPVIDTTSGQLAFTPTRGLSGTATITVALRDDGGTERGGVDTSAAQTFTITLDAPASVSEIYPAAATVHVPFSRPILSNGLNLFDTS